MSKKFKPIVFVDFRENDKVKNYLKELGSEIIEKFLTSADYIVSEEYAFERKELSDFFRSIFDGRLFEQIKRMKEVYINSCLIVEGNLQNIEINGNPKVFWGALSRIIISHKIQIIFTPNKYHTALFLNRIAKKLQEEKKERIIIKHKPKKHLRDQLQVFAIQSLPLIGPEKAKILLQKFRSVKGVFNAKKTELLSIKGFGEKSVKKILDFIDAEYGESKKNSTININQRKLEKV